MKVFIIGITGNVGTLLADQLLARNDQVHGLVRRPEQKAWLVERGIDAHIGDLAVMTSKQLAALLEGSNAIVFSAGSNGGAREITKAIDGDGVVKAIDAARLAGVDRFALVSVLPESWRERDLGEDVEYYFRVKKQADIAVSRSGLDWLSLRPSLLLDDDGIGMVSLGPAEWHGEIPRADVAATLATLLHEPCLGRRILELNTGETPIKEAVHQARGWPARDVLYARRDSQAWIKPAWKNGTGNSNPPAAIIEATRAGGSTPTSFA